MLFSGTKRHGAFQTNATSLLTSSINFVPTSWLLNHKDLVVSGPFLQKHKGSAMLTAKTYRISRENFCGLSKNPQKP